MKIAIRSRRRATAIAIATSRPRAAALLRSNRGTMAWKDSVSARDVKAQ